METRGSVREEIEDRMPSRTPVLRVEHLSKWFGGAAALRDVDFEIDAAEVHALIGHNGSGKSTLIKTLSGYHNGEGGCRAWLDGEPLDIASASEHRHDRLRFVHQDLGLVLEMNAVENLALHGGFARTSYGRVRWTQQEEEADVVLSRFGLSLDLRRPLSAASPVERTVVAIAAALQGWSGGRGVLVLDEPTALLPPEEAEQLFEIVKELRASGTSVLYVSHRLDELFVVADRVTVLRNGEVVACREIAEVDKRELVRLMLGSEASADLAEGHRPAPPPPVETEVAFEGRGLSGRYLKEAAFSMRHGEILGLAGRPGSGSEELPYVVAGAAEYPVAGTVRAPRSSEHWVDLAGAGKLNSALVPADRTTEGMIPEFHVGENLTLRVLDRLGSALRLDRRREASLAATWIERLNVGGPGVEAPVGVLSGGNQQKVLIGRNLALQPDVLLLCEPTAGVDIQTREAIYGVIAGQADEGVGVLVSSSDVGDLAAICNRVLVFHNGRVVRELVDQQISEQAIVHALEDIEEIEL